MTTFNKLIIFLIRLKFHLKKGQRFRFANQKSKAVYFFSGSCLMKEEFGFYLRSSVSLNWILSDECKIVPINP